MDTLILKAFGSATGKLPRADKMSVRVYAGTDKTKILPCLAAGAGVVTIEGGVFVQADNSETTSQNFNPGGYNNLNIRVIDDVAYVYFPAAGGNFWEFREYIDVNVPVRTEAQPRVDYTSRFYALGAASRMFSSNSALNRSVSGLDLSRAWNFSEFFAGAIKFNSDVHKLGIKAQNASAMFSEAWAFNGRVDGIVGTQTFLVDSMFKNAYSFNQPLTDWDLSGTYQTQNMFFGATSFDQDISKIKFYYEANFLGFLTGCGMSPANYDKFLIMLDGMDFSARTMPKIFEAYGVKYSSSAGQAARASLVTKGWTIYDGGKA